jgi:hypothetical protein
MYVEGSQVVRDDRKADKSLVRMYVEMGENGDMLLLTEGTNEDEEAGTVAVVEEG